MESEDAQIAQLKAGIAALEAQRSQVGDSVVDAALGPMREKLAALEAQAQPVQQRKLVTVLFADVSGFTALSEARDAEEVAGVMNDLWTLLDTAILDQGGRIDKHIGDAVMALWGTEAAREDDPERAVRAALAMQAAVALFCTTHLVPLAMRIGVNTGPVLLGAMGTTGEFTAMGDAVNLASRLEHAAPVGGVLIAHGTYRHIRGVFDVQPQEPLVLKGKTEPVQTYVVQRAKPRAFRLATRGVEGIETRMIGREAEMLTLQTAYFDTTESSEARVIFVVGEAGVGKSRLLYEFNNWLELRPETIRYFKGRATPNLRNVPHSLFRDLFAYRFDILDSDSAATALEKFRAGMAGALEPEQADVVGHWLGFDFSASSAVENLLGSPGMSETALVHFAQYFHTLAAAQPVVILLEDIHWADDSSLDLIAQLAELLPATHLLVVAVTRPSLFERRPGWGEGEAAFRQVRLSPLSRRASRHLVDEILQRVDEIPEGLRNLIIEAAEGNPFYVEEMVKMLIDQGVIERGDVSAGLNLAPAGDESVVGAGLEAAPADAVWRVRADKLEGLKVPPTLTGLLQARLDGLPRPEREALQRASVVGRLFWDDVVADLMQAERAAVAPTLEAVRRRELIFRRERSSFVAAEEYIFKHALLRDVTYETVLLKNRAEFHGRVARWLEQHAGERLGEYLSLIAEHYALAGDHRRAADYFERAGNRAYRLGALDAALTSYRRIKGLGIYDNQEPARSQLDLKIAQTLTNMGDFTEAEGLLAVVSRQATILNDSDLLVRAIEDSAWCALLQGNFDAAEALSKQLLPTARALGGARLAWSLLVCARVHLETNKLELAKAYFEEGLALAYETAQTLLVPRYLTGLGSLALLRNDLDAAEEAHFGARRQAMAIGNRREESMANLNLGNIYYERGDYRKAQELYRSFLEFSQAVGNRRDECLGLLNLSFAALQLGALAEAERDTRRSLELSRRLGLRSNMAYGILLAGKRKVLEGDTQAALMLFGAVSAYGSIGHDARRDLGIALDELAIDPAEKEAGLAAGAALDLETVVGEILDGKW